MGTEPLRTMYCPDCNGHGEIGGYYEPRNDGGPDEWIHGKQCRRCGGDGRVTAPEALLAEILRVLTEGSTVVVHRRKFDPCPTHGPGPLDLDGVCIECERAEMQKDRAENPPKVTPKAKPTPRKR